MADVLRIGTVNQTVLPTGQHRTWAEIATADEARRAFLTTHPTVPFLTYALGDIWLPPAIVMGMFKGLDVVSEDPISEGRWHDIEIAQETLARWYPDRLRQVKVYADVEPRAAATLDEPSHGDQPQVKGPASCFTGGVDSFHTLITRREEIGALMYGFGLDIPLHRVEASARVQALLERVSTAMDMPLLTAQTNIRRVIGRKVHWGFFAHGAALASLATIFSTVTHHALIPATHSVGWPLPWGSHPLLDPHWSTSRLQIEHTGTEANRARKIQLIADDPVAQENLRVCYSKFEDLNCGECAKCMRTMAALRAVDRLDKFTTFGVPLDLEQFAAMPLNTEGDRNQIENLAHLIDEVGGDRDLADAVSRIIDNTDAQIRAGHPLQRPGQPRRKVAPAPPDKKSQVSRIWTRRPSRGGRTPRS